MKRFWSHGRKLSYKRGKEAAHHLQPLISQMLSRFQFSLTSTESRKEEFRRHNYTLQLSTLEPESVSHSGESQTVLGKNIIAISNMDNFPARKEFQLARTCITQHTQMSLQRRQDIFPHLCSLAVVPGFPREPSTWLLCSPDSKLCLPWPLEPALNG